MLNLHRVLEIMKDTEKMVPHSNFVVSLAFHDFNYRSSHSSNYLIRVSFPALSEEVTVDSPNVAMKITDRNGGEVMPSAEVGDPLALKFEILDKNSPYEIFVRELVAMDGVDNSEIVLIDSSGCPTDHFIMGPIYKSAETGKVLKHSS